MKNVCYQGILIGALFLSSVLYSQESRLIKQEIPTDYIQALKDTLVVMSDRVDNELFKKHCAWFAEVIDAQDQLTAHDSSVLAATYDTFCLNTSSSDCREFSAYLNRERPLIIAWQSPTDGKLSFAAYRLPLNWDRETAYPLYIHLHGLSGTTDLPIDYLARYFLRTVNTSTAYEDGYMLMPWGRGNKWYQGISETDILECREAFANFLAIDPQRQYLLGHSMGGYGSWYIASRHPALWAAVGLEAAALQYGNQGTLADANIQILKNLPLYFIVGVQDGLYDINLSAYNLLNTAGAQNTSFVSFIGGHEHLDVNEELMYLWLRDFVNEDYTQISQAVSQAPGFLKCFPNPFAGSAKLSFKLEKSEHVILSVYTLQGQLLETLMNKTLGPGYHEVTCTAGSLPPGTYVCRMESGGEYSRQKLLLVLR